MRAHWRMEEWVLGLLYFWAGSCYTFSWPVWLFGQISQNTLQFVRWGMLFNRNEVLINHLDDWSARMLRKLARVAQCHAFTWPYSIHFIPTNMVRTRVRRNLSMRKQNTKTTWRQSVVPNDFPIVPISLYIEQSSRYFCHVVRSGVY